MLPRIRIIAGENSEGCTDWIGLVGHTWPKTIQNDILNGIGELVTGTAFTGKDK